MTTSVIQPSFAAGELSPTLHGRVDLAKYKIGAAKMRNFFVDYRGGATSRPGTRLVGSCYNQADTVRLIPFKFSTVQTYVLEFGPFYIRVIKDGAYVLETNKAISSITQANPGVITSVGHGLSTGQQVYFNVNGMTELDQKTYNVIVLSANTFSLTDIWTDLPVNTSAYGTFTTGTCARLYTIFTDYSARQLFDLKTFQSADVMTICHPEHTPVNLTRTGHAAWTLTEVLATSSIYPPGGGTLTFSSGGTAYYSYQITSVSAAGEESVGSPPLTGQGVDISTTAGSVQVSWPAAAGVQYYNVYRALISPNFVVPVGATHGYIGMTKSASFIDKNITADFTKTPPLHNDPFSSGQIDHLVLLSTGAGYASSGTTAINITDANGVGASFAPYVSSGQVLDSIKLNGGYGYVAPVVTVVSSSGGVGASFGYVLGGSTGTYPSCGCYFQQRRIFAATLNQPQTLWGSQPGNFTNFDSSIPTVASDAFELTISSTQVNDIKWVLPMAGGLVVLTGGGAWQVTGDNGQNSAVTPSTAIAIPQAYNGCHTHLQPIVINYDILYVQAKGSIVRDLSYNFFTNIYTGIDISALSNHLFNAYELVDWSFAEEPFKLVWVVRSDGKLLCLTYIKEQEVYGWTQHDTQGEFKSTVVIQEGTEDVPYFVVKRYLNGRWINVVEQMASRVLLPEQNPEINSEQVWAVDSGLQYAVNYPAATVQASATTGTITLVSTTAIFVTTDVGKVFRGAGGRGTVTAFNTVHNVTVVLDADIVQTVPDDPDEMPVPLASGSWSLQTPVSEVTGLEHLEGKSVKIVADGSIQPDQVVVNGTVTLEHEASMILVGLGFQCQLQTLPLEIEAGGTVQGKRKKFSACTLRVVETKGLKAGPDFDNLIEYKPPFPTVYGDPVPLESADQRIIFQPAYTVEGQICVQQDYPMPATVLAVIPEVELGDTR